MINNLKETFNGCTGTHLHWILGVFGLATSDTLAQATQLGWLRSALFSHSHLVVFSEALIADLIALFMAACHTQSAKDFTKRATCKASTANFYGLVECPPAPNSTSSWYLACFLLLVSALPRALLVPAWSGVFLKTQRWWSCLAEVMLQRAGQTSAVFPGQCSWPIRSFVEGACCCLWTCPGSFSSLNEGDFLLWSELMFDGANGWGYAFSNGFEYLVMALGSCWGDVPRSLFQKKGENVSFFP